jgi:hypothetical protein
MTTRALRSAPEDGASKQVGEWVTFLHNCEKLRLIVLEKEEYHAKEVKWKSDTLGHYKWKHHSVFTGLSKAVNHMKRIEKLGPITPRNVDDFEQFNFKMGAFFPTADYGWIGQQSGSGFCDQTPATLGVFAALGRF